MSTNKYLINLLSSYLAGECPEYPDDIDLDELLRLAGIHGVAGIAFTQLQKVDQKIKDNKSYINLENLFFADMMRYSRRCNLKETLILSFKKQGIKYAFVKGSILCDFYANPELRTMGDLDILIDERDKEKAHNMMLRLGAQYFHEQSQEDELKYRLNKVTIELHTKLICDDVVKNGVNYEEYFADEINNLKMVDDVYGEIPPERHIIFIISHMARHFSHNGCGIRMFMDLHVIKEYYKDSIDIEYIGNELKKLNLDKFTDCAFQLCNYWFNSGFKCSGSLESNELSAIEKFVLEAGAFGKTGRNNDVLMAKRIGIFRHIFPTYRQMRQHSDWFVDKPAILLPAAYIERGVRNLKERGGIIRWIKGMISGKEQVQYHKNIMDMLGL